MKTRALFAAVLASIASTATGNAQTAGFDLEAYKQFLSDHSGLQASELQSMHPVGSFQSSISPPEAVPLYLDSVIAKYALTPYELNRISKHGFVVTSRLARHTFVEGFADIFHKDLPVFVSSDAILQAVHNSYDNILMEVEKTRLVPLLNEVLAGLRSAVPALDQRYGADERMSTMLRDVDVYLTVPSILLGGNVSPYYPDNAPWVNMLLQYIEGAALEEIPLFAATTRSMDFSQFTVRGHYTKDAALGRYFRAMIWLGRTELYLVAPQNTTTSWPEADIQRQVIDAVLLAEAVRNAGGLPKIQSFDSMLRFLVGESDNVIVDSLLALVAESGVASANELLDTARCRAFQELLLQKPYAEQRILSQVLMTDPMNPALVRPASAFMLLGQRFVIDSYVLGNVVYDKITWEGRKVRRMLPSTLDPLFALGNDAVVQLLQPELEAYHYAPNLAGLRYLVDSYGDEFWSASMFNAWLSMIRTLNPPADRSGLPEFMRTAAWWQEKINTQLASWAQLRHDNLLYAKQSYTPGIICSYPHSYVEPIPRFYDAVRAYAAKGKVCFEGVGMLAVRDYFGRLEQIADTLGALARKELAGTPFSADEQRFLRSMLVMSSMCGDPYSGWYPGLFYGTEFVPGDNAEKTDFVVADVHTAPTDDIGFKIGWVMHAGTGPVDIAIICANLPGTGPCAFVGPVMNFYEHLTTGFKRLTDEEWANLYNVAPTLRPSLVNLYLADEKGGSRGSGPSLVTGVDNEDDPVLPAVAVLFQNYPNPFNASTVIPFSLPASPELQNVSLDVIDIHGRTISRLVEGHLPGGNYTVIWKGQTLNGRPAATGVYFYRLMVGEHQYTRKLLLIR